MSKKNLRRNQRPCDSTDRIQPEKAGGGREPDGRANDRHDGLQSVIHKQNMGEHQQENQGRQKQTVLAGMERGNKRGNKEEQRRSRKMMNKTRIEWCDLHTTPITGMPTRMRILLRKKTGAALLRRHTPQQGQRPAAEHTRHRDSGYWRSRSRTTKGK